MELALSHVLCFLLLLPVRSWNQQFLDCGNFHLLLASFTLVSSYSILIYFYLHCLCTNVVCVGFLSCLCWRRIHFTLFWMDPYLLLSLVVTYVHLSDLTLDSDFHRVLLLHGNHHGHRILLYLRIAEKRLVFHLLCYLVKRICYRNLFMYIHDFSYLHSNWIFDFFLIVKKQL